MRRPSSPPPPVPRRTNPNPERAPRLVRAPSRLLLRARLVAPLLDRAARRRRRLQRGGARAGAPRSADALGVARVGGRRRGCAAPRGSGHRALRERLTGQLDREGRALAWLAGQADRPPVRFDDPASDPESQAEATESAARNGALELPEHARLVRRSDADAVVPNPEHDALTAVVQPDFDRLAGPVFGRVADQVVDDLIEAGPLPGAGGFSFQAQPHPAPPARELFFETGQGLPPPPPPGPLHARALG